MERFELSERQAQAILDMRLRALTAMERQRVIDELEELRAKIADLKDLLASDSRILEVVVDRVEEVAERFGDERRTELTGAVEGISNEDLIVEEDMVVTLSHLGYIKRNPITLYRAQRRGGKGARGMETRDEDFVEHLGVASTHAYLLFFTNRGRIYWLKVHELPQLGRAARGKAIVNVLQLQRASASRRCCRCAASRTSTASHPAAPARASSRRRRCPPTRIRAAPASSRSTSATATS